MVMSIVMSMVMSFAQYSPIILSCFLIIYLIYTHHIYNVLLVGSLFIFLNGVIALLKYVIARERDPECLKLLVRDFTFPMIDKYSMPSGHSAIAGFITGLLSREWKLVFMIISLVIMFQRVIYKCHTIVECIIGFAIGYIFGLLSERKIQNQHKN